MSRRGLGTRLQRWAESSNALGRDDDVDDGLEGLDQLDTKGRLTATTKRPPYTRSSRTGSSTTSATWDEMDDLDDKFSSTMSLSQNSVPTLRTRSTRPLPRPNIDDTVSTRTSTSSTRTSTSSLKSRSSQANLKSRKSQADLKQVVKDGQALKSIGVHIKDVPDSAFSGKGVLTKISSTRSRMAQTSSRAGDLTKAGPESGLDVEGLDWAEDIDIPESLPLALSQRSRKREHTASSAQSSSTDLFASESEAGVSSSTSVHASPSPSRQWASKRDEERAHLRKMDLPAAMNHIRPDNEDAEDGFDLTDNEFMSPPNALIQRPKALSISSTIRPSFGNNVTPTGQKVANLSLDLTPRGHFANAIRASRGVASPAPSSGSTPSLYESDGDLDNYDDLVLDKIDSTSIMQAIVSRRLEENRKALLDDSNVARLKEDTEGVDFTEGLIISEDNFNSMQLKRHIKERERDLSQHSFRSKRNAAALPELDYMDRDIHEQQQATLKQGRNIQRLANGDVSHRVASDGKKTAKDDGQRALRSKKSMIDLQATAQERSAPRIPRKVSMPSLRGSSRIRKGEEPPVPNLPNSVFYTNALQGAGSDNLMRENLTQHNRQSSSSTPMEENENTLRVDRRSAAISTPSTASQKSTTASRNKARATAPRIMRAPHSQNRYGDGTELDHFDDLPTNRDKETKYHVEPVASSSPFANRALGRRTVSSTKRPLSMDLEKGNGKGLKAVKAAEVRRQKASQPSQAKRPMLLRNLSVSQRSRIVGQMVYNPDDNRWEGNEGVLQAFESALQSPHRPALIAHVSSQMGTPTRLSKTSALASKASAHSTLGPGAKIVGDMLFDPNALKWVKRPDLESEAEEDPFADIEDLEESQDKIEDYNTISSTAQATLRPHTRRQMSTATISSTASMASVSKLDRKEARPTSIVEGAIQIPLDLWRDCQEADRRHRAEMIGWVSSNRVQADDRSYLYQIRQLLGMN